MQSKALASKRPAHRLEIPADLMHYIFDNTVVGRRCATQHRDSSGQRIEDPDDSPVVGPKVVPPETDAMRLIHRHKRDLATAQRSNEPRVAKPFRGDIYELVFAPLNTGKPTPLFRGGETAVYKRGRKGALDKAVQELLDEMEEEPAK